MISQLLENHLNNRASSFSIGSFGAIAEFHRLPADVIQVYTNQDYLESISPHGGIRLDTQARFRPVAYETISKNPQRWQQGIAFCLPQETARMPQHQGITELGPDHDALQPCHRTDTLFDLGIAASTIHFCIRTQDKQLINALRQHLGQNFFSADTALRTLILRLNPHRVILSKAGRIEVYQAIGLDKTPDGSHTHLLPKLLATGRTHSANIPIPTNWMPVLQLYPEHALKQTATGEMRFDASPFNQFQDLLQQWGRTAYVTEKANIRRALLAHTKPEDYALPQERYVRAALKITLRQQAWQEPDSATLSSWQAFFNNAP